MCDATAGPRRLSQTWAVQRSPDTKEKMKKSSSQFIKSLLTQTDSSASMIDVNQILIHEHSINMVAHFTLPSYSVWLFIQKLFFKIHKLAIEDSTLLLGSELGIAVGITGLSLWILTIKNFGILIL